MNFDEYWSETFNDKERAVLSLGECVWCWPSTSVYEGDKLIKYNEKELCTKTTRLHLNHVRLHEKSRTMSFHAIIRAKAEVQHDGSISQLFRASSNGVEEHMGPNV